MSTPATIGVDDDLTSSESCVTLGTSNDELARRIDVQVSVITKESQSGLAILQGDLFQSLLDHMLHNQFVHLFHAGSCHLSTSVASTLLAAHRLQRLGMLRRDHYCVNLLWLHRAIGLLQVFDSDLGLAI